MFDRLARGLEHRGERWCLGASVFLCVFYVAVLAGLQGAGTRFGDAFLAQRDEVRLLHVRQAPFPFDRPVALVSRGQVAPQVALLRGWSEPEGWGAWTDGRRAELAVMLPRRRSGPLLLRLWGLVVPPPDAPQVIDLYADGQAIGEWRIEAGGAALCSPLPPGVPAGAGVLRIGIGIGAPHGPPGGGDQRQLGFGLERVEISSSPASCAPRPPAPPARTGAAAPADQAR